MGICDGRVVIVTGGGRGLGRAPLARVRGRRRPGRGQRPGRVAAGRRDRRVARPGRGRRDSGRRRRGGRQRRRRERLGRRRSPGGAGDRRVRRARHRRLQRRHRPRPHAREHVGRRVGRGDPGAPPGMFCPVRHAIGYWRDEHKAERARRRASSPRRRVPGCAGRSRSPTTWRPRPGSPRSPSTPRPSCALRRRRQHHRAVGPQPDDRGRDARDDGATGDRLRRDGSRQRVTVRRVARERRLRRHRPRVRDGGR